MINVNIAVLKAKLSFYLGQVRRGQEVLVMDRSTPVAKLVPSGETKRKLVVIKAKQNPAILKKLKFRPLKQKTDIVALLRKDRDRR